MSFKYARHVIGVLLLAATLASCSHHAGASAAASAIAHPASSAVQKNEQLARAALKQCFPQTLAGEAHLLSRKAAGDGHTAGYDAREKVYGCMDVPPANRPMLDREVQADLFQVHDKASFKHELDDVLPGQVAAARQ